MDAAAGAISLDSALASNFSVTGAADLTLHSSAGAVNMTSGEANTDSINITSGGGMNVVATGASGKDIVLTCTSGSIHLTGGEAASDAINIDSTGGVDVDAAGQINLASSQNAADAIYMNASAGGIDINAAGAAGEDITVDNTAGSIVLTAGEAIADSMVIESSAGGIDILASGAGAGLDIDIANTGGSVNVSASEADAAAVVVNASAGGLQLLAGGGAGLDTLITNTSGSVSIDAGESAADAFVVNASGAAGGVQLQAGTGGVLIGNQADCTTLDLGNFAPTASRTITVGGGTVVTASVTDTIDIAPDGATTNADSVKTLNLNAGGVTTGQVLTNIASGTITSGTHTTSIVTGNVAAGTVALNVMTGTGTKTFNVGNADASTTLNLDTITNIADSVNANTKINTGTSTGTVTIGNAAAGAITVDSSAGISIDAATASNFACAAGDMTVDATTGSLILSANEDVADAIQIVADNGGIDITCSSASAGQDIDILNTGASINITATESVSDAINITASGAAGAINLSAGTGGVTMDSGLVMNVTSFTVGTTAISGDDYICACDTSGGAITLTLPASPATGRVLVVVDKNGAATASNITIDGNGNNIAAGGTAAATKPIDSNYGTMTLVYTGTIWNAIDVA